MDYFIRGVCQQSQPRNAARGATYIGVLLDGYVRRGDLLSDGRIDAGNRKGAMLSTAPF